MRYLFCCISLFLSYSAFCQKTSVYSEKTHEFERGLELYDKGVYGSAYSAFENASKVSDENMEPDADLLRLKSQLMMGKSAVRIGKPDAEMLMLNYFRQNVPDALAFEAVMDLGNYYYDQRKYEEAISFYEMIDPSTLSDDQRSEIKFKEGYAKFVKKDFSGAKSALSQVRNIKNDRYFDANYYYALSAYYTKDYKSAVESFKKVQDSKRYKSVVPVHIAQILLAQKKFDELVAYAEPLMDDPDIRKQAELRQMLGQAYFEMGDYEKARPFLEEYAASNGQMREDDLFQLGVTQYKLKEYQKSIDILKGLADQNSEMGMYAMFYMADSYLKLGDKAAARNAFFKASGKKFDPVINEEALFNYAKLSVELGYDREAINTLQNFKSTSPYYSEAQVLISDVLINTKDYEKALKILESIPNKSPQMMETYQMVLFYRGVQLHNQKGYELAYPLFKKSIDAGTNRSLKAQAYMLIGDGQYQTGKYEDAKKNLNQFVAMADGLSDLPPQTSISAAKYDLGYIYLNEENYKESLNQFEKSLTAFRKVSKDQDAYVADKIVPDLVLRIGDNYLISNNYKKADQYFNEAINNKYANFVYAIYQSAIIDGLQKDTDGKLKGLNYITSAYPNSEYADEALMELGNTYDAIGNSNAAIAALNKLVNDYKSKSTLINKAYLELGLIYYNKNDYDHSLSSYKAVVSNNPTKDEVDAAMTAIKEIYVNDLKKPDAYFAYAETVPGFKGTTNEKDEANFQVADTYYQDGKYAEAIKAYTDYLAKYDKGARSMEAYFKRGECNLALKQYGPAEEDYKKVISFGQSNYYKESLEKAAIICYNYSKDFNEAYNLYKTWLTVETIEDKKLEAQLGALRSAYRIEKHDEVVPLADLVINNSRSTLEQKSLAHFYKARSAQDLKNYNSALESYNFVIRNSANIQTAEARYRIAQIYFVKGDYATAEDLAQKSAEENNAFPYWVAKSLILLSDVLSAKGDYFNAKAALEAVIDNFNDDKDILAEAQKKLEEVKQMDTSGPDIKNKDSKEMDLDSGN